MRDRGEPFRAVVADMDGVLTRSASLHRRAWKETFDAFLDARDPAPNEDHRPFTDRDYREHVDGKPRYDGVRDFLASRQIELRFGDGGDVAGHDTVRALGRRKNEAFLKLLERDGAEAFDDAVVALDRWRRGGLPVAAVSASRNCRRILDSAGLLRKLDLVVDGADAQRRGLDGKGAIMAAAIRDSGLRAADVVAFEDALAGVRAARAVGFGRVFGVARDVAPASLIEAGADQAVRRLDAARFPRPIPRVEDRRSELDAWRAGRRIALLLNLDGALAPLADEAAAELLRATRDLLEALASKITVVILSERETEDLGRRFDAEGLLIAGHHGFDLSGPGLRRTRAESDVEPSKAEALQFITRALSLSAATDFVIHVGGGEPDEEAFLTLAGEGAGIRVGPEVSSSLADYRLDSPDAARRWLASLL